ncbi:MAG TPA: glycosyltransferase family 2 protein [Verrucomicrobiae bacterium]|jgi:glycosyltransferase involved in cell wall biosynthesis|nr:glycosyltransferase family 2 protein [Verrucomicrobiae bacterium]
MKARLTTVIPVRNGQEFITQTLESLAAQTVKPDRVIVLDNISTDATRKIVTEFKGLPIEFIQNPKDLGVFGNFDHCLDFADQTEYMQILHADDVISPRFYEEMIDAIKDCPGRALAWCVDERINERNQHMTYSGKPDGRVMILDRDTFLARKAEIGNQSFCATLLKTNYQPAPARFPLDMLVYGDMVYWARFGAHADKIAFINKPLAQYRWHETNQSVYVAPNLKFLVDDAWNTMQMAEKLRGKPTGKTRQMKLQGLMAVRCHIMAKRFRQLGNIPYSKTILTKGRTYTSLPIWLAGQMLVELRELLVFKIGRRPRHRQNIFS